MRSVFLFITLVLLSGCALNDSVCSEDVSDAVSDETSFVSMEETSVPQPFPGRKAHSDPGRSASRAIDESVLHEGRFRVHKGGLSEQNGVLHYDSIRSGTNICALGDGVYRRSLLHALVPLHGYKSAMVYDSF